MKVKRECGKKLFKATFSEKIGPSLFSDYREVDMNWFERYGIIGAYNLISIFIILTVNKYFSLSDLTSNKEIVIALFGFSILPVGYIVSIFSQFLYYHGFNGTQVHKEAVKSLPVEVKSKLNLFDSDKEQNVEVKMTVVFRLSRFAKSWQYLEKFGTKRWDVLAVNSAMILSTILLIIFDVLIKFSKGNNFCFSSVEIWMIISGLFLILLLRKSYQVLCMQVIEINKELALRYVANNEGNQCFLA
jgi:hypothetical protein